MWNFSALGHGRGRGVTPELISLCLRLLVTPLSPRAVFRLSGDKNRPLCQYLADSINRGTTGWKVSVVLCVGLKMWCVALSLLLATVAVAQFPGGRFLEGPVPQLCAQRKIHDKLNNKGYYFSWRDPATAKQEEDWLGVRNWCRMRCMDAVSLQTSDENEWIKTKLVQDKIRYIWTSGRICDFKGCDRADLQPKSVNGWFWTSDLQKLPPTTNRAQNDWSPSGGIGQPQPDNREEKQNGAAENCLALLNNFYGDGIHWHDVACHHRKPFVCEESDALLKWVRFNNPELRV